MAELPNPFVFLDGTPVKTHEDWARRRREMIAMVLHYQFGHAPEVPAANEIDGEIISSTVALDGQAVRRAVRLSFGPDKAVPLSLGIHTPKDRPGPFPVIVHNSPGTFEVEDSIVTDLVRRGYALVSCTPSYPWRCAVTERRGRKSEFLAGAPSSRYQRADREVAGAK